MNVISPEKIAKMQRRLGRMFKAQVPDSPELARIRALPRRIWQDNPELPWLIDAMSRHYRLDPNDEAVKLLPEQAAGLADAHDYRGLFGPLPCGCGKTLLSYLLPLVLEAKRPLLTVPAKLLHSNKTRDEFAELALQWKRHQAWDDLDRHAVSYEKMSREGGTERLQALDPDLVIFDEAHHVRNPEAAVTRKFEQHFRTHDVIVVVLTGTSVSRSVLDFSHLLRWSRPAVLSPLPLSDRELVAWAAVVDEIKVHEQRMPGDPSALYSLCTKQEKKLGRDGVRAAVRRRIQETPGVVASEGSGVEAALNIELTAVTGFGAEVQALFKKLDAGIKPNGDPVTDNDLSAQWAHARTLTSGFWYERYPKPPESWLEARRAWKRVVNSVLGEHLVGLESEKLVAAAANRGHLGPRQCAAYQRWRAIKDEYKDGPKNRRAVWVDDTMVRAIERWSKERTGIIWVSEVALGDRLEQELGLPYYHELSLDNRGRAIKDADPKDGCVVASVSSVSEGNNLQRFSDNLIISLPPTGTIVEQMLSRTHRRGQQADEVWCEVFFGCLVEWNCWLQARRDASLQGHLEARKRLSYATVIKNFELKNMRGPLWV